MRRIVGWSCIGVIGSLVVLGVVYPTNASEYSITVNLLAWIFYLGLFGGAAWGLGENTDQ